LARVCNHFASDTLKAIAIESSHDFLALTTLARVFQFIAIPDILNILSVAGIGVAGGGRTWRARTLLATTKTIKQPCFRRRTNKGSHKRKQTKEKLLSIHDETP
jgi:hypothetical protein